MLLLGIFLLYTPPDTGQTLKVRTDQPEAPRTTVQGSPAVVAVEVAVFAGVAAGLDCELDLAHTCCKYED